MSSQAVQGRRLPDTVQGDFPFPYDDLRPGDIWRVLTQAGEPMQAANYPRAVPAMVAGNLTGGVWHYRSPDGGGIGTLVYHTVREHDDGTVSIRPGDGSSNSVLHHGSGGQTWHGYVDHCVWESC